MSNTKDLYNENAKKWARSKPTSLSDFTGRPPVIDLCGNLEGLDILDLGCGEGYVTRQLLNKPLKSITSVDLSEQMIESAKAQCDDDRASFHVENAVKPSLDDSSFDLVVAVFVYNYLFLEDTFKSFKEVYRMLKPGGAFVFSVPHPAFPFMKSDDDSTFHFDFHGKGYFSSRDDRAYFEGFAQAGFTAMPIVKELGVKPEHLELNPDFFGKVADKPLHMAFRLVK